MQEIPLLKSETTFLPCSSMNKILWLTSLGCLLMHVSCTYDKIELMDNCYDHIPATVSFKKDLIPFFNANCNTQACHSGTKPKGNLNLEPSAAYTQLSKKGSGYIDTLNPNLSLLYSMLVSSTDPMPPTRRLSDCEIETVYKWIRQGGRDN